MPTKPKKAVKKAKKAVKPKAKASTKKPDFAKASKFYWDAKDVEVAELVYAKYVGQGYHAYSVNKTDGTPGPRMKKFDPKASGAVFVEAP